MITISDSRAYRVQPVSAPPELITQSLNNNRRLELWQDCDLHVVVSDMLLSVHSRAKQLTYCHVLTHKKPEITAQVLWSAHWEHLTSSKEEASITRSHGSTWHLVVGSQRSDLYSFSSSNKIPWSAFVILVFGDILQQFQNHDHHLGLSKLTTTATWLNHHCFILDLVSW